MPKFQLPALTAKTARYITLAALLVVLGVGVRYWLGQAPDPAQPQATSPAVPVQTALAVRTDVPVYLDGLGTVQAFNTVTVTTRVDGELQSVNFTEGQDVKAGDVLAQIDPRPFQAALDQAVATLAKDQAQLADAKLNLARDKPLAEQEYLSQQMLDDQRALVDELSAQTKMDQAAIDLAKTNLDYTTIKSPIDGRTGIRLVDAGNNVLSAVNTPLVVVTQLHPISTVFTLPQENVPSVLQASAAGTLTVIALSRDLKTELDRGTVAVINNQIAQTTGTIELKATFPNAKSTLWPGQFVNARLLLAPRKNVVAIPSPAVQRGPNGTFAYVVKSDSTVEIRPLMLSQLDGDQAVVESGLQPGERVVTAGQYRLQAGTLVESSNVAGAEPAPSGASGQTP